MTAVRLVLASLMVALAPPPLATARQIGWSPLPSDGGDVSDAVRVLRVVDERPPQRNEDTSSEVTPAIVGSATRAQEEARMAVGDEGLGEVEPAAGGYTVRVLLQTRYQLAFSHVTPELSQRIAATYPEPMSAAYTLALIRDSVRENDGFAINRAFLRLTVRPGEVVSGKLLIDFAELLHKNQKKALKLSFVEIAPNEAVSVRAGLFKIPFSLLELLPIADFEFADVGPTDDLIKDLGFGGRDIGLLVDVAPLKKKRWMHIHVGIFRGDNAGAQTYRGPGIVAARVVLRPNKHMRLGIDGAWRPRAVSDFDTGARLEKFRGGVAGSADLTIAYKKFELRAEAMGGDRTDLGPDAGLMVARRASKRTFVAMWAILTRRFSLPRGLSLLPAIRAEWLDEEREEPTGAITCVTGGLNLDFEDRLRLVVDLSRLWVQAGTRDRNFEFSQFRSDATVGIIQLQIKM